MSWFCITEVLLVPLIWSMSWSKTFVHWRWGLFFVHFFQWFWNRFLLDSMINDSTLERCLRYNRLHSLPGTPKKNSRIIHQSPVVIENVKELVGFPGWWGKKNIIFPCSQRSRRPIGHRLVGRWKNHQMAPRLFASICHDVCKQTYT